MKTTLILLLGLLVSLTAVAGNNQEVLAWARILIEEGKKENIYRPEDGYVPDEQTAINIALSVWHPIYGKEHIQEQKPYSALLVDGYWIISGSLPKLTLGGVAHAVIEKNTGQIVYVIHSK